MAWVYADRVLDTSVTTGTGALTVSGTSPLGWRTFSTVCAVADQFYYTIVDPITGAWETGEGSYSATNTVTRTTVRASSNANALVSFAANSKSVFIDVIGRFFASVGQVIRGSFNGGTSLPMNAWTTLGITQISNDTGVALVGNTWTPPAGRWQINWNLSTVGNASGLMLVGYSLNAATPVVFSVQNCPVNGYEMMNSGSDTLDFNGSTTLSFQHYFTLTTNAGSHPCWWTVTRVR
jgi:hypothetical protein